VPAVVERLPTTRIVTTEPIMPLAEVAHDVRIESRSTISRFVSSGSPTGVAGVLYEGICPHCALPILGRIAH
jgi:hypothetical protein